MDRFNWSDTTASQITGVKQDIMLRFDVSANERMDYLVRFKDSGFGDQGWGERMGRKDRASGNLTHTVKHNVVKRASRLPDEPEQQFVDHTKWCAVRESSQLPRHRTNRAVMVVVDWRDGLRELEVKEPTTHARRERE
ncbi:unnamed protein product [Spodoptera exigua]|nr:unnamed protein product [Spodoptera exigua]